VSRVTTFDVNYENRTLFVVSDKQLKKISFDSDEVTDLLTAVNASGLCTHWAVFSALMFGGY